MTIGTTKARLKKRISMLQRKLAKIYSQKEELMDYDTIEADEIMAEIAKLKKVMKMLKKDR